jgi:hypothetical protein
LCLPTPHPIEALSVLYIYCSGIWGFKLFITTGGAAIFLIRDNSTCIKGLGQLELGRGADHPPPPSAKVENED